VQYPLIARIQTFDSDIIAEKVNVSAMTSQLIRAIHVFRWAIDEE
jgi:hypothetical protein